MAFPRGYTGIGPVSTVGYIGAYVRAEEYLLVLKKRFILCALVL